jgi:hypothetical protein
VPGIVNVRRYWPRLRRSRATFALRRFRASWASSDTSRTRVAGHAGLVAGYEVIVAGYAGPWTVGMPRALAFGVERDRSRSQSSMS